MADDPTIPSVPSAPLPPEPEPLPVTPPKIETPEPVVPPPVPQPTLDPIPAPTPAPTPVPVPPPAAPQTENVVESILETKNPESVIVPGVPSKHHSSTGPKKPSKGPLIALIALLLLILPVSVYFISQQNQQLADIRSKATLFTYSGCKTGPGYECCKNDPNACQGQGGPNACHCQGGDLCTGTKCENLEQACRNDGREWCDNYQGFGKTCCVRGYVCASVGNGCVPGGGDDDNGDDDDDTTATPTPTTGVTPVCQNIKLYKDGTQVTDLTTLRPGDEVVLAVKGNLNPTKAHFRVNGGAWNETTTKNANDEFTWAYTIIDGVTDFVIEGEVFTNGAWH